ncbi:hypothetical protein SK128_019140 [Halocaridina rubra]|uniref:Fibronectin type-III domain-containing protein n=1 Tax=Halocaridina rubra TaxID=373956 RepID=A0AAN8XGM3_HALRR
MTETEVFSGQIHLTQLEPGTTYSARFCLQYREGLSSWSEYSQFVTDKVPHPGMSAWLIVVISLSCIALSVLLVLCFTYSRGKIKDVLQDLNRDLNIPIGENAVGRHYSQGQETQGYISRKDYYEYFHSMEEVGLGKEDPETKLSDSDPSSTSSSPKFVKEGRSLTTGENAIPGTDEEEEKLLQGNSSSNTTTFDLKGSFINNQKIPKNTGYVQVNIPITVTNGNVPGSESSPHSHFSSSSTNGYVNPDSHFMSKSGYVAHDSGAAFMGYSTVSGDEHQESHELEVCKSLHYEAGNDESKNYVSSDHMNNSTTEEIAKVKEKVLLNSMCPNRSGYVQLEYTLDNQPLVLKESTKWFSVQCICQHRFFYTNG